MPQQVGGAQEGFHYTQLQETTHLLTTTTAVVVLQCFVLLRMCAFIHKLQISSEFAVAMEITLLLFLSRAQL